MTNPQDYGLYILILGIGEAGCHVCAVTKYFGCQNQWFSTMADYCNYLILGDDGVLWGWVVSFWCDIMDIHIDEDSHLYWFNYHKHCPEGLIVWNKMSSVFATFFCRSRVLWVGYGGWWKGAIVKYIPNVGDSVKKVAKILLLNLNVSITESYCNISNNIPWSIMTFMISWHWCKLWKSGTALSSSSHI